MFERRITLVSDKPHEEQYAADGAIILLHTGHNYGLFIAVLSFTLIIFQSFKNSSLLWNLYIINNTDYFVYNCEIMSSELFTISQISQSVSSSTVSTKL